jgi:DNA-binding NarL/FixJ family response regulator
MKTNLCGGLRSAGVPRSPLLDEPSFGASVVLDHLVSGRLRVAASYCSSFGCHLDLEPAPPGVHPPCSKDAATLERILLGETQKEIAFDFERSVSTINARASRCLQQLGIESSTSNVPTALLLLVRSARGRLGRQVPPGTLSALGPTLHRLTFVRPGAIPALWSPAERCLIDALVEGLSRGEMARLRHTSLRTIANQMAQVYRKASVSGRIPFLNQLIEMSNYSDSRVSVVTSFGDIRSAGSGNYDGHAI